MVEYIVSAMPKNIPANDITPISLNIDALTNYGVRNNLETELVDKIINLLRPLETIKIKNLESTINDTAMGYLGTIGRFFFLGINVSGLMGNADAKTKDEIINFSGRGGRSINNFKSILGHELRHLMQSHDYSSRLKSPNDDDYDYNADPLEIDASFMEALLDHDIDSYNNAQEYANDVIEVFKTKKQLSQQNINFYYKKIAKFFAMYKDGDAKVHSLKDRFYMHKEKIKEQFLSDFDKSVSQINNEFSNNIEKDFKKLGGIPKDDRQSYYISIGKPDTIRNIIVRVLNGEMNEIPKNTVHLIVASIAYANTKHHIRNHLRIINKIYEKNDDVSTISETIEYISENGYFKKDVKYIQPIIEALTDMQRELRV